MTTRSGPVGTRQLTRGFIVVFAGAIALHVALIATRRMYPFVDLPFHMAAATVLRSAGDPGSPLSDYYSLRSLMQPNVAYPLFCSLPLFPSVEIANRVALCMYVVAFPTTVLLMVRRLRGNPWFSLLALPLLYNYNLSWGFMGFALAAPVVIAAFCLMLDYLHHGGVRRGAALAALLVLAFFLHALATLFLLLILAACSVYHIRMRPAGLARMGAAALPTMVLLAVWWRSHGAGSGPSTLSFLSDYYLTTYVPTLLRRGVLVVNDNSHLFGGTAGIVVALILALPVVVPAFWWLINRRGTSASDERRSHRVYAGLFALCALLCWFLLPDRVPGNPYLYQRFSIYVMVSAIALGSMVRWKAGSTAVTAALVATMVTHLGLYAQYFTEFDRVNASFAAQSLPSGASGRVMGGLIYERQYRGMPVYTHYPSYYIVWKKGPASTTMLDYRFGIIGRKARFSDLPRYRVQPRSIREDEFRYGDLSYLLVRGHVPDSHAKRLRHFRHLAIDPNWSLYINERAAG